MSPQSETLRIGSDHVIVHADRLLVISRARMDGWEVRSYRQALIRFRERDWRIAETRAVPPDATQYTLVPWDLNEQDVVGHTIEYGLPFVIARDGATGHSRHVRRVSGVLRLVAPFTGFLPARTKDWLEVTYGLDSVATTKQSVLIQAFAATGVIGAILVIAMVTTVSPFLFVFFVVLVLLDAGVRWTRALNEERPPPGLFEWAFRDWWLSRRSRD
jgi:hypothetical protein